MRENMTDLLFWTSVRRQYHKASQDLSLRTLQAWGRIPTYCTMSSNPWPATITKRKGARFSDRQGHQQRKVCSKQQGENTQLGTEWTRPGLLWLVKTHLQQEPGAFWHELQGHHGHSGRQSTDDDKHSPAVEVIIGPHAEAPACKEAEGLWKAFLV